MLTNSRPPTCLVDVASEGHLSMLCMFGEQPMRSATLGDGASVGICGAQQTSSLGFTSNLRQIPSPPSASVACCVKSLGNVVAVYFPSSGEREKKKCKTFGHIHKFQISDPSVLSKSKAISISCKLLQQSHFFSVVPGVSDVSWFFGVIVSFVLFCVFAFHSFVCFVFCCCFGWCCLIAWLSPAIYSGWPQTHFRIQIGLELKNLLPQPPPGWLFCIESGPVSLLVHQHDHELEVYLNFNVQRFHQLFIITGWLTASLVMWLIDFKH